MSTTPREPLLSDQMLKNARCLSDECLWIRGVYEAARAKDAERIEQLEAICRAMGNGLDEMMRPANRECDGAHCTGCWKDINGQLVKLLFAEGFKPSDQ